MIPLMATPNRAMLSILGLYNWNDSLFDQLHLPDDIDSDEVVQNILMECAELTILYPDWDFLYNAINYWSLKELPTWERMYEASQLEYNPIENYDRIENEMETSASKDHTARQSHGGNRNNSIDQNSTLNRVTGFNTTELATQSGTAGNNTGSSAATGDTFDNGDSHTEDNRARSSRIHGNIGVTTSQQMLEQELAVAAKLNIINIIVESFKQRFCVLVY